MIVKYLNEDTWVYLDKITKTETKHEDGEMEFRKYNKMASEMPQTSDYKDPIEFLSDGSKMREEVIVSNKIFSSITQNLEKNALETHCENLISPNIIERPIKTIVLSMEDKGSFDKIILITNQMAYLMNDKGQTIERLN